MKHVLFYHGWGCDHRIWDRVVDKLPAEIPSTSWDRGYFGQSVAIDESCVEDAVVVTHSMGWLQVPPDQVAKISALLVVNGFVHFVPQGFESDVLKPLRAMKRQLTTEAANLVGNFRQASSMGDYEFEKSTLRSDLLGMDLDRLSVESINVDLMKCIPKIEFIHSKDDVILHPKSVEQTKEAFPEAKHHFFEDGGHAAPFRLTETVVRRILALL